MVSDLIRERLAGVGDTEIVSHLHEHFRHRSSVTGIWAI